MCLISIATYIAGTHGVVVFDNELLEVNVTQLRVRHSHAYRFLNDMLSFELQNNKMLANF